MKRLRRQSRLRPLEMKEKLWILSIYLLCFQTRLSLASIEKIVAATGNDILLPCNVETQGDIQWLKNDVLLLKYINSIRRLGASIQDRDRFKVPSHHTNDLKVTKVKLSDSGTFTCKKGKDTVRTVELFVVQVSANPSAELISSEDLELSIQSSPEIISGLQVTWMKDGKNISTDSKLVVKNVQREDSGSFECRIKIDTGNEVKSTTMITVKGLLPSPAIVYTAGKHPITIPWLFNFKVQQKPLSPHNVCAAGGNITFQSKVIKKLTVTQEAACWHQKCDQKTPPEQLHNLSVCLPNPSSGHYEMAITLKAGAREKTLMTRVCVANLTVSVSPSDVRMDSTATLLCNVTCIDPDGKLCWSHTNTGHEICGQVGTSTLAKEVTAMPETVGNWTCSVLVGAESKASANLILEVQAAFLDASSSLFWVTVGVGVLVLLLFVVTITVMTARCRRMRRARYRAWLLQNVHQQRRCQCKGFAPKLLSENI
ncbi:uncharacterized protein LOC135056823 [Pseudophryne corroboree]|uniref:uncharacterized protein LOC135056823 n=1 Tax=Pseudophryne corroboree TaxID=495146 RepID=UPI003081744C